MDFGLFDHFQDIVSEYLPVIGEGQSAAEQIVTCVVKLIYSWYYDGLGVFRSTAFPENGDLSTFANWLYRYVPETRPIFESVVGCSSVEHYEWILYELADLTLNEEFLYRYRWLNNISSIYQCSSIGPFKHEVCCVGQ